MGMSRIGTSRCFEWAGFENRKILGLEHSIAIIYFFQIHYCLKLILRVGQNKSVKDKK